MDLNDAIAELFAAAKELAEYASYAEIVGGVSVNRPQVRKWCDAVFAARKLFPEDENYEWHVPAVIPLEACNARVAAMVEAAAEMAREGGMIVAPEGVGQRQALDSYRAQISTNIRALATADHTAALDAMIGRAREEALAPIRDAVTQYHLALDRHDNVKIAGYRLQDAVQKLLGMPWRQGAVLRANAMDASEGER